MSDNTYTYDELAAAVAASQPASAVHAGDAGGGRGDVEFGQRVRRLGAEEVGGTQAYIGRQLRRYEIDISHFTYPYDGGGEIVRVSPDAFLDAAKGATSIIEVVHRLDEGSGRARNGRAV